MHGERRECKIIVLCDLEIFTRPPVPPGPTQGCDGAYERSLEKVALYWPRIDTDCKGQIKQETR